MAAEVQLFVRYTEADSGIKWNMTVPTRYVQTEKIIFIDEQVRFERFTVDVALVSGSLMSPLLRDPVIYGMCTI